MPVRDADPGDFDEICAMIHELAAFERAPEEVAFRPDDVREHLFGPRPALRALMATSVVGGEEGKGAAIAGMALWYPTYSTWVGQPGVWLEDLFIRPAHRRQGLATQLLSALAERSAGRVEWAVLDWNQEAISFYDRLGAYPVDGWTRYRWVPPRSKRQRSTVTPSE
jgi:GNAT superfamily N-acetyltransferase